MLTERQFTDCFVYPICHAIQNGAEKCLRVYYVGVLVFKMSTTTNAK